MALNLNKAIIVGRMTADPELRNTQSGISVTSFNVAVNRPYQKDKEQEADFISVTAWRGTAEFVSKYFKKGSAICVVGSIQTRHYTTDDGKKRYITEVVADEVKFVESRAGDNNTASFSNTASFGNASDDGFIEMDDDENLPF